MEKTIEKTDEREVDHRSPYHRFGPQIERLQRSAEQGEQEFKEAMTILQSMKSEVSFGRNVGTGSSSSLGTSIADSDAPQVERRPRHAGRAHPYCPLSRANTEPERRVPPLQRQAAVHTPADEMRGLSMNDVARPSCIVSAMRPSNSTGRIEGTRQGPGLQDLWMNASNAQVSAAQLLGLQLMQQRAINSLVPQQPSSQSEAIQRLFLSILAQSKLPTETAPRSNSNAKQVPGLNAETLMRYESMEASDKRRKYINQVHRANTVDGPSVSDTVTSLSSSTAAAVAAATDARAQPFRHPLHTMGMSVDSGACSSSTSSSFDQGGTQRQAQTSVENMLLAQISNVAAATSSLHGNAIHNVPLPLQSSESDQLRQMILQRFAESDPQQLRHWLLLQSPQMLDTIRRIVQTGSDDRVQQSKVTTSGATPPHFDNTSAQ